MNALKNANNDPDNHHIYVDSTGFAYDILLTKVDTSCNHNERYALAVRYHSSVTLLIGYHKEPHG